MYKQKELVLRFIKERLNEYIVNSIVSINIKHGIIVSTHKDYAAEIKKEIEDMLNDQIIYAYYEIHYYATDIIYYKLVYTMQ